MSKGYIMASHSNSSSMDYYLRKDECIERFHSSGLKTDREIKDEWKQIVNNEKYGNKELGIRGRHDARISTNYTITLPNNLTPKENLEKLKELIKDTPIEKCTYTIVIHKGEKNGIKNSHAHLIVNERNTETMKKDREMIKKDWLKKDFQKKYENVFEKEFSQGKTTIQRNRIETYLFKADEERARAAIYLTQMMNKSNDKILNKEQSKTLDKDKLNTMELFKKYAERSEQKEQEKEQSKTKKIEQNWNNGFSL